MSQNNQQQDSSTDILYIGAFLLILYLAGLYFLGEHIAAAHLWLRKMWLIAITSILPTDRFEFLLSAVDTYHPREWTRAQLATLSKDIRLFMFLPLGGIFAWYAWGIWVKNPGNAFRRVHTRKSLCSSEVRQWPWIAPVLNLDLAAAPIDKGPWAMSRRPLDFARRFKLLEGKGINRHRAEKLFASQLGALWEGPEKLSGYKRGLFACFIAQACRDKTGARDGLERLALSMAAGKLDASFADGLIEKHYKNPLVQKIVTSHAYVITVMCAALEAARRNGVLQPATFVWLRPVHRPLWYSLNGVGRRTAFCEISGIHAHYLAEKIAGEAIERPYVTKAVDALEKALREVKYEE